MHEDYEYVKSLVKEVDELESKKADFSNIYDLLLKECVSKDVTCSYLHSLPNLNAYVELQCLYFHKVKECKCLAQKLSKQTESVNKEVLNNFLEFAKLEIHSSFLNLLYNIVKDLKAQMQTRTSHQILHSNTTVKLEETTYDQAPNAIVSRRVMNLSILFVLGHDYDGPRSSIEQVCGKFQHAESWADSAMDRRMQDELHQFDRLKVWELVDKTIGKMIIKLKGYGRTRRMKDQTIIRNTKHGLVAISLCSRRGYPEKVYLLRKALYGLKQSSRAWYVDFQLPESKALLKFLGDKLVSWMSKKQNCTAMSSAEAEYVALSASLAQVRNQSLNPIRTEELPHRINPKFENSNLRLLKECKEMYGLTGVNIKSPPHKLKAEKKKKPEHPSDTYVFTMKMEILLEPASNKLLVAFKMRHSMRMLVKDTRSQDGIDDKDNDKGSKSRSQSMKEQAYNKEQRERPRPHELNDKSNLMIS
ncbi:hypothetical protein Tco_0378884 [Tanacetum coccineum]